MAVTVGTDSYGDETGLQDYADARGVTIAGDLTQLLIKAMDYIESRQYTGNRYDLTTPQPLEFPRDWTPLYVPLGTVPQDVITAQYVAALLIDSGEDLQPVVGRALKRQRVEGAVEREWMDNASETKRYPQLSALLGQFMASSGTSFAVVRV